MIQPQSLQPIYLDANATTPVLEPIATKVMNAMLNHFGNPSSAHITGVKAKRLLEETRSLGRDLIGTQTGELLFTSGATEGIQTAVVSAISGYLENEHLKYESPVLLYGATEHKAVPNTLVHWNKMLGLNARILEIPVDNLGLLDHNFIAEHVQQAVMICTMAVNNETGVVQNLTALEETIRAVNKNAAWLVDCVQALGKIPLVMDSTSIDYAPFSGHKLYAPKGIGFLYIRSGRPYTPFIAGGGQESGMRSGTENLPGIVGLKALFELLKSDDSAFHSSTQLQAHRALFIEALNDTFEVVSYHSELALSVATTINFSVPYLTSKEIMDLFDAVGIRVSGGSACSAGATSSFVLEAMKLGHWECENAVRLSFGPADDSEFIAMACESIRSVKSSLQKMYLRGCGESKSMLPSCIGLTQLVYGSQSCWLYVTENSEAFVYNPVERIIPKLSRIILTQDLKCKAILLKNDSEEQKYARNNLHTSLGQHTLSDKVQSYNNQKWVLVEERGNDTVSYLLKVRGKSTVRFSEDVSTCLFSRELTCSSKGASFEFAASEKNAAQPSLVGCNTIEEAKLWLSDTEAKILDVREQTEHDASIEHIKTLFELSDSSRVINIPRSRLANAFLENELDANMAYLLICRTGTRSKSTLQALTVSGFMRLENLNGGLALD
ncbi:aminotransferase class V-fold PLP-dependent enzyme [Pseudoalteromonas luteoviolacea]|uniref:aminotransferase class V-fold PLP-dependent enzyme n=1 Tax=Pseudoalteromonas luteoviolacea TaxID=43657 RepID=UPI001B3650F6|nr:aminotransferase class V-fold PLP-dependent enzyme [Pseudoalteromonas luteoviolacea]